MVQVIKVTFMDGNEWKLPFNFAVFLHLTVILGAIYGPGVLNKNPPYQDIYTVDLINFEEPKVEAPPPAPQQTVAKQQELPKPESVNIAPKTEPVPEVTKAPVKPVSIKPLKRKKVKKNIQQELRKKEVEKLHKKNLAEAREAEKKAAEAARIAAAEAVNQLKSMLRETNAVERSRRTSPSAKSGSTVRRKRGNDAVENQYFASIFGQLQPHWKLPEYKTWSKDLSAVIVIRIASDGKIIDQFFEKRSGDRLFDKFVLKALQDGSPLPKIPPAMQKNSVELGLRFVPGSIN